MSHFSNLNGHYRARMNKQEGSQITKTIFAVPTDAHYYKIIEMLKQI